MTFEKIPIVELMERYGVDLIEQGYGDNIYYKACCPLHDETDPSFCVYPASGKFVCFAGCGSGDVIDFVQKKENCSFNEALKLCTTELSSVEMLLREIDKFSQKRDDIDIEYLKLRSCHAFDLPWRLDISEMQQVLFTFDNLMKQGRWLEADSLLRANNL